MIRTSVTESIGSPELDADPTPMGATVTTARRRTRWTAIVIGAATLLAGCGGDDDAGDTATDEPDAEAPDAAEDDAGDGADVETDESGEATLGDPCELLPASEVEAALGVPVEGTVQGVGDGLAGSSCLWSADGAPAVSIGFTPDGASFVETNRTSATDSGMEVADVDIGDGGFLLSDIEIQVASGGHQVIVTVVGGMAITVEQLETLASGAAAAAG